MGMGVGVGRKVGREGGADASGVVGLIEAVCPVFASARRRIQHRLQTPFASAACKPPFTAPPSTSEWRPYPPLTTPTPRCTLPPTLAVPVLHNSAED